MLTCQRALGAYVLKCQRALCALVLTCSRVDGQNMLCVPTCSRALTSNKKVSLQGHVLLRFFGFFSLSFSCEIKFYMTSTRPPEMSLETFIFRIQ